jgi:hypothetical protein
MQVSRMRRVRVAGMRMEPEARPDKVRKLRRFISGMVEDDRRDGDLGRHRGMGKVQARVGVA